MLASRALGFRVPSNGNSVAKNCETFRGDSWHPLEGGGPEQREVKLYLVKEIVLHALGKARRILVWSGVG